MTREDFNKIYNKVRNEYSDFNGDYNEWYDVLNEYSYEDILKRLEERRSSTTPIHTHLIKNLKKEEKIEDWITECEYCKTRITIKNNDMTDYYIHHRRCQKIDFIDRMSKRYRGQGISSVIYYQMSDEELDKNYQQIMDFYRKNRYET